MFRGFGSIALGSGGFGASGLGFVWFGPRVWDACQAPTQASSPKSKTQKAQNAQNSILNPSTLNPKPKQKVPSRNHEVLFEEV